LDLNEFKKDLERLEHEISEVQLILQDKLIEHLNYHTNNEAKWGIVKIMRDHPFKTLLTGIGIGVSMFGLMNANNIITFFARIMR